ncbi:uncharacterized protein K460DRAFT_380017 [Cucurbitaria berberidis CBS 394.84]|uniref:Myb-like domain-containing protein n=1 Tax=Cucurbitaria berberidis CBS 394.84 TaxID=1168544 RepID=A0A9P4GAM1_9PLEO|nr:uncharacterized protein K460DRAFT_380017 [Cucurbitaria berberidis CBS 394.84]KAF1842056.1 hypothetical protein K460DRAFT_380017 [Cucurbitaria berberidis CBS 394.84]
MADRRGVRSATRRKTPTPQPPSKTTVSQVGPISRAKRLRSASRDAEDITHVQKPTRQSARQASVTTTITEESDHGDHAARRTKRRPVKEPVADLTTVEEIDTLVALDEAPGTPTGSQSENPMPYPSPGAASEMSGTTAISSFSMVEAEFLEPKYILKHLRKLCESADEFLEHLAPDNGTMHYDMHNIHEIQKPDSDFTEEYRDFDLELDVHLKHFKDEERNYIHFRAVHRALFGVSQDVAAEQTGLDLILHLTNLLVFAKNMIHSDRNAKEMWDALRQLDNSFPSQFVHSLVLGISPTAAGESALREETFDLALDLRTQLFILVLERSIDARTFNPDAVISEVFYRSDSSQATDGSVIRGWNVPALGGDDSALPQEFENSVVQRLNEIRKFFVVDGESRKRGQVVNLEGLSKDFPWELTILRLLGWVRLRHRELYAAIDELGGPTAIVQNVKQAIEEPQPVTRQVRAPSGARDTPRKKRASLGRERRRSSRKFDPNAPVDLRTIDALKARERDSGVHFELGSTQEGQQEQSIQEEVEEPLKESATVENQEDDYQPVFGEEDQIEEVEEQVEEPEASGPPTSSAAMLRAMKATSKPQKENRPGALFERQATARRVEFGNGFDESQPTPGPSNKAKGKQPAQVSPKKRPRQDDDDVDSEDDAFETEERGARVQERRQKAPLAKKVRIDLSSSGGAPTSHQPPPRHDVNDDYAPKRLEQDESESEAEAPSMAIDAPPKYSAQRRLALENTRLRAMEESRVALAQKAQRARTRWTEGEEEALIKYMAMYPSRYATILEVDKHARLLEGRTQVDLKDKARTMAYNMIRSGTGLRPGFQNIIKPTTKYGKLLVANNFTW